MRLVFMLAIVCGLGSSPFAAEPQAPAPPNDRLSYLENDALRIGVDLKLGGAITYLSPAGEDRNVINSYDYGRQVQMSYYSGPVPFTQGEKKPSDHWSHLGWNPIQTGDDFDHPSRVVEHRNDGREIYVRCIPMIWPLENVPAECEFECWIQLSGATAQVRCRLTNNRDDKTFYGARRQELPAIYTTSDLYRLMTYNGDRPFGNDEVRRITYVPRQHAPWTMFHATERWAALVDDDNWGLGVYTPGTTRYGGGFAGQPNSGGVSGNSTGYLGPGRNEIIDHNIVHEYEYTLLLGSLESIRQQALALQKPRTLPDFRFEQDRQGWYYANAKDQGWPIRDGLQIDLSQDDPQLLSPPLFFRTEDASRLEIELTAEGVGGVDVYWQALESDGFTAEHRQRAELAAGNQRQTVTVELSGSDSYRGGVVALRIDPEDVSRPSGRLHVHRVRLLP